MPATTLCLLLKDEGPQGDERVIDFNNGEFSVCLTRDAFVSLYKSMQKFDYIDDNKHVMLALDLIDLPEDEDDFDA